MSLQTQSYKGARDIYPEDMRLRNYIFNTWRSVAESFGYEEYDAPLLESVDIYAAKSGEEIVSEQTYQFTDRGDRNVAIRPEMTPSISRMVAARRQEMPYPARLFSISNFMRYERPQKGREREFWQLNADMFGVAAIDADAEIIIMSDAILKAFDADRKMYTIRINDRRLTDYMMTNYLNLDVIQAQLMIKLFDRKDKITPQDFKQQAENIFGPDMAAVGLAKIAKLVGAKSMAELPKELLDSDLMQDLQKLFVMLKNAGITNAKFDVSLMRGFDYYTGVVFEVFDEAPENRRSMFGGGRYDGLIGLFGVDPLPVVGVAPGETTMMEFLRAHDLVPKLTSTTDVYMIVLGDSVAGARKLANDLRNERINVAVDISGRKLDKQIKAAVKMKVPYMLFVGETELKDEIYSLKDVDAETEQKLSFERIVTTIRDYRRRSDTEDDF